MWWGDQGCTLSTLFSNYICYMTAVSVCATDLNCYSKLCFVRSVKKTLFISVAAQETHALYIIYVSKFAQKQYGVVKNG